MEEQPRRQLWTQFPASCLIQIPPGVTIESARRDAEKGNFLMGCVLAQMLMNAGDEAGAFEQFSLAAVKGSAPALYNAALMLEFGLGTPVNVEAAESLYHRAAGKNFTRASHRLGYNLVRRGDVARGVEMIHAAAKDGLAEAMYDMGMVHLTGIQGTHTPEDASTGLRWMTRAVAECGDSERMREFAGEVLFQLALYYHTVPTVPRGAGMAGELSAAEKAARAYEYAERAAHKGIALAQDFLGQLLVVGAVPSASAAAESSGSGSGSGQARINNLTEAMVWFEAAAAQGVVSAKRDLGLLLEMGPTASLATDDEKAYVVKLYTEAADAGDALAQFRLGVGYGVGKFGATDLGKARELILQAAQAECVPAIAHLITHDMVDGAAKAEFKARLAGIASKADHPARLDAIHALSSLGAVPSCRACGVTPYELQAALSRCSVCQAARYCSRACQRKNWGDHREECNTIVRAREELAAFDAAAKAGAGAGADEAEAEDAAAVVGVKVAPDAALL